ncbi:MAG: DUF1015 family protein [Kofleriaceae bacterium]
MPHVAGLRGVVPEQAKVSEVVAKPLDLVKGLADGSLTRDQSRAVYRYHQTFAGGNRMFTRKSFACAVRLHDWVDGEIRGHEAVAPADREQHLTRLRTNKGHTEALLCGMRDPASEVERLFRGVESGRPLLDVTTSDGTNHKLWRSNSAELIGKLRGYFTPKKLHLLEGHALYEAALAYRDELGAKSPLSMYSSGNYALAYVVSLDDSGLVSAPAHRVITGSTAKSADVLAGAKQYFIVETIAGGATDLGKVHAALTNTVAHQPAFAVIFANEPDAHKLTLSPDVSPANEGVKATRAVAKLDPFVIEHLFVGKHLGSGTSVVERDAATAIAALGKGASVALITRPLTLQQITHVDEVNDRLPAHSTAFHPAIAQGLVSFVVDADEDVV